MSGRRGYSRRPPANGKTVANRYAGSCVYCGDEVPAGVGLAVYRDGWRVQHRPAVWSGSPVSGRYVGGCPVEGNDPLHVDPGV